MNSSRSPLTPNYEPNPTALIAWTLNGLWYVETAGVPMVDFESAEFESLDEAIQWGKERAQRVVAQEPETAGLIEIHPGGADQIERIRRMQISPTTEHEPVRDAKLVPNRSVAQDLHNFDVRAADSWYLVSIWEPAEDPDADGETWRIPGGNRIADVLQWIAERVGRRYWSLHLVAVTGNNGRCVTWLQGDRPTYGGGIEDNPRGLPR